MSNVYLDDSTLTGIANAIRTKTGGSSTITPANMATEIGNIPTSSFPDVVFEDNCERIDLNGNYDWLFRDYSNKITFRNVDNLFSAFNNSSLEDLSGIEFNFNTTVSTISLENTFNGCRALKKLPIIGNDTALSNYTIVMNGLFVNCFNLKEIPNDWINKIPLSIIGKKTGMFIGCLSLREIPQVWLNNIYNNAVNYTQAVYYNLFNLCSTLNEITNLNAIDVEYTANQFGGTFNDCYLLKNLTFKTDNGTPYVRRWKNQTLSLYNCVGYCGSQSSKSKILDYNSGITADKEVTNAASYELLKNDPDWFAVSEQYSKYNHDSAVATINSLPDTSAYIATAGGTNTIAFKAYSGSATDGGAINTLTAAEIAVATNKGWTVSLV